MASPETSGQSPETKGIGGKELKKHSPERKKLSSAEREALERDLAERGERAEKVIEKHRQEKEPIIKSQESGQEKSRSAGENSAQSQSHRPNPKTDKERNVVYKNELKKIQKDLPSVQKVFSKVIHNSSVEKISETSQNTIFRPSALIAGSITGLTLGIVVYVIAIINNYGLGNLEIFAFAILGALIGLVIEYIAKSLRHRK